MEGPSQDPFGQTMGLMDDIKEKLSDQEYLQIVNALRTHRSDAEKVTKLYACTVMRQNQKIRPSGETIVYIEPSPVLFQLTRRRHRTLQTAIARFGFAEISRPPTVLYSSLERSLPITIQLSQTMVVTSIGPAKRHDESPVIVV